MSAFTPAAQLTHRRLILSAWAEAKQGKTTLALSGPEPVYVLNWDFGTEELLGQFPGKDIRVASFKVTRIGDPAHLAQLLVAFEAAWKEAIEEADKVGGTVVLDTATILWQVIQTVKLEEVKQRRLASLQKKTPNKEVDPDDVRLYPYDYAAANTFMASILRRPRHHDRVNAVILHHAKEKYNSQGQPTGELEFQGFNQTPGITQAHVRLRYAGGKVLARVDACRFNASLHGNEIELPHPSEGSPFGLLTALFLGGE